MKIALPTQNDKIDPHFGHCEYYTVFAVSDEKKILSQEIIKSPAGCGCKSNIAQVLKQNGVTVMLAGNMGDGAVNVLSSQGIQVVRGCSGDVKKVTENWLSGSILDSGVGCHEHEHGCDNH
ncbi:MAG: NifB/NifX family molybdenum-iron cluster-binding protein [Spirochaetes bacterium]|nr:NifB/NifX family molybdenum-iron cluster-binding protein [Spirochaetota bacterium]